MSLGGFSVDIEFDLQEALRESDLLSLRPVTEGGRRCENQKYLKREPVSQAHDHLYFVQDKHFILQVHISRTTITTHLKRGQIMFIESG